MAGFQAVDLDSILDEFEFKQNEAEKEKSVEISIKYPKQDKEEETWSQVQPAIATVIFLILQI